MRKLWGWSAHLEALTSPTDRPKLGLIACREPMSAGLTERGDSAHPGVGVPLLLTEP